MRTIIIALTAVGWLTARGESPTAFGGRCIPRGCVAPPSHTPGMLGRHALPGGRIARLGATPDFHHGLLGRETDRRGEVNRKTLVVPWRRTGGRNGEGSQIGRAQFLARPAGAQPLMLRAV